MLKHDAFRATVLWKMAARARLFRIFGSFLLSCGKVFIINVLSLLRVGPEPCPVYRRGFSALPNGLFRMAAEAFRRRGRGFPVLQNRFRRVVKTMERTFYPHFSVSRYLFLRICNVNRLISVNICMISRHRVCCTGAFPPSWRVRSSAVQPELR